MTSGRPECARVLRVYQAKCIEDITQYSNAGIYSTHHGHDSETQHTMETYLARVITGLVTKYHKQQNAKISSFK